MQSRLNILMLCLSTLAASTFCGCALVDQHVGNWYLQHGHKMKTASISMSFARIGGEQGKTLTLSQEQIEAAVSAPCTRGNVEVFYSEPMRDQAEHLAEMIDHSFRRVRTDLGLELLRAKVCLVKIDGEPEKVAWSLPLAPEQIAFVFLYNSESASAEQIICNSAGLGRTDYYYCLAHEAAEATLINPRKPIVLPDMEFETILGIPVRYEARFRTRWFRDGFANYAAFLAAEELPRFAGGDWPDQVSVGDLVAHKRPFSSLAHVKTKLFDWDQCDGQSNEDGYYDASLALFLLIDHRFGKQALRDVLAEVRSLKFPDGKAVERAFERALRQDLRKLVADFAMPDLGMTVKTKDNALLIDTVRQGGLAEQHGLAVGDKIVSVQGNHVRNYFDYEMGIFTAHERRQPLSLLAERNGRNFAVRLDTAGGG